MKKILLLLAFATYLFSCKDTAPSTKPASDSDTLSNAQLEGYPQISKSDAESMVKRYANMKKNDSNIIRSISFGNSHIRGMISNTQKVRIYIGAHIKDSTPRKIGDVIVILQIKKSGAYAYYDYASIYNNTLLKQDGYYPPIFGVPFSLIED